MKIYICLPAMALLTTAALTGCNQMASSSQQQQANANKTTASSNINMKAETSSQSHQDSEDNMKRISIDEAKAAVEAGKAIIVDVRDAMAYKTERIKGSINIPMSEFETRYKELPADKQIIPYCS